MAAAEKRAMKNSLSVDTSISNENRDQLETPKTAASTPTTCVSATTPDGSIRGSTDLRSPGMNKTPAHKEAPIPDFITQTDANGNAVTPRTPDAIKVAKEIHPSGPEPKLHVNKNGKLTEEEEENDDELPVDACETLLDSIRLMCCCLLPEDSPAATARKVDGSSRSLPQDMEAAPMEETKEVIKLLPKHHPDDHGKKCLVLDLDETLVHSSFRAVQGADFVIPVQVRFCLLFVSFCILRQLSPFIIPTLFFPSIIVD
jgi:TFIIF-interacting CTD phosphatase-like protein